MITIVQKEFRKLIPMDEARALIAQLDVKPRIIQEELGKAYGRILAHDVISDKDVPPFTRASMDGYAVHANDTYQAREDRPIPLKVVGSIEAGKNPAININKGQAAEIATGAVMPTGADAVVMVEYTTTDRETVSILHPVSLYENVMQAGSDIMAGERVLKKGMHLGVREIGVLAAIGKKTVPVSGINVGIISTGNELVEPGRNLDTGQIYDINSFSISAGVMECKGNPLRYPSVRDDETDMKKTLKKAAQDCDIILTSGSTSAGSGDMMYRIIEKNGRILAHGIDIKPGKPAIIGEIFGKPIVGLPGYPASSVTIFNEFVAPLIRRMTGNKDERIHRKARLSSRVRSEGRTQLLPVGIVRGCAYPIWKGSGAITTLSEADGFIEIPGSKEMVDAGETVDVTLFQEPEIPDLLFIGSHCFGLDALIDVMKLNMRVINVGSSGGFSAIKRGIADIAGVHLLDEHGEYNVPFLKRFGIHDAVIVKGYRREQGLMVRPDSTIQDFEDILGSTMINRNSGSGTRILTDRKFQELAQNKGVPFEDLSGSIRGYHTEAKTHSAVAAAVRLGKADVGVGIRTAAELNGLTFIKIADEEYDFVISLKRLQSIEIKEFLKALRSKEFKENLPSGLHVYERTGELVSPDTS